MAASSSATTDQRPQVLDSLRERARMTDLGPVLAGTVLPVVLVLYLALRGGGYDAVVRSEVGIAVWWIIVLGAVVGLIPAVTLDRRSWVGLGLFAAFAAWAMLAITWSESAERTVAEIARIATYLGVLALALTTLGREGGAGWSAR